MVNNFLQELILSELRESINEFRSKFPRLYFLSESETVALLSVSRNPTALVPHVKKCFSGISNLTFALPKDVDGTGTSLDYSLFGELPSISLIAVSAILIEFYQVHKCYTWGNYCII